MTASTILGYLILSTHYSYNQWLSSFICTVGVILTQLKPTKGDSRSGFNLSISTIALIAPILSGFAFIFVELFLKSHSVALLNFHMGWISIILHIAKYSHSNGPNRILELFTPASSKEFSFVIIESLLGIVNGLLVQSAGTLAKNLTFSMTMASTVMIDNFYLKKPSTMKELIGSMLIIFATVLYSQ